MKTHTNAEVLAMLDEFGMMSAPVHNYGSMFRDEGILEQDMLITLDHPVRGPTKQVGMPWKLTSTPATMTLAPPTLGQHTDEILAGAGCDSIRIRALRERGIIW